jgi:hypothetical protein
MALLWGAVKMWKPWWHNKKNFRLQSTSFAKQFRPFWYMQTKFRTDGQPSREGESETLKAHHSKVSMQHQLHQYIQDKHADV